MKQEQKTKTGPRHNKAEQKRGFRITVINQETGKVELDQETNLIMAAVEGKGGIRGLIIRACEPTKVAMALHILDGLKEKAIEDPMVLLMAALTEDMTTEGVVERNEIIKK